MSEVKSHRDLVAWQKAYELGKLLYRLTRDFPDSERFGLTSQLRRSGISVASNIAEGYGRATSTDYLRFLRMARGELFEIDTQVLFARDLGFMKEDCYVQADELVRECGRVLAGLIRGIEKSTQARDVGH